MRGCSWLIVVAALLAACGGDDDGNGTPATPDALYPVPRDWSAGEQLAYVLLSYQRKVPTMLRDDACTMEAQFGVAVAAGRLPESGAEGACIVTDTASWLGLTDPTPACAGVIDFRVGDGSQRVTICGAAFTMPLTPDCAGVAGADTFLVESGPDEAMGDVIASLAHGVEEPGVPLIRTPAPQGDGTALWPDGPDLDLAWDRQSSSGVEIVIGQTSGTGPQIRCLAADTGSFTVPGSLLAPYRSGMAFVEVAALSQNRVSHDGFETRISWRESDAIWLFP
jgi:hypothetical protein